MAQRLLGGGLGRSSGVYTPPQRMRSDTEVASEPERTSHPSTSELPGSKFTVGRLPHQDIRLDGSDRGSRLQNWSREFEASPPGIYGSGDGAMLSNSSALAAPSMSGGSFQQLSAGPWGQPATRDQLGGSQTSVTGSSVERFGSAARADVGFSQVNVSAVGDTSGQPSIEQNSPSRRLHSDAGAASDADPIHRALLALEPSYPIVAAFQRVNVGFYKIDGRTCEISLARTGEKLFAQLDSWNRGVRGELVKFLQSVTPPADDPMQRISSEKGLSRGETRGNMQRSTSPPKGMSGTQRKAPPSAKKAPSSTSRPTPSPKTNTSNPAVRRSGVANASSPRADAVVSAPVPVAVAARFKAGALLVSPREPGFAEPVVLLRSSDRSRGEDAMLLVRSLCTGRVLELPMSNAIALETHARAGSDAHLSAFEEVFFTSQSTEIDDTRSVFGHVELGELSARQLAVFIGECWPPGLLTPIRGLAWPLVPFFVDWLKRRLRPRLFTQLVVSLSDDVLERSAPGGMAGAPSLQGLLLDLTERDLLIATLLAIPIAQRSRLYALASETKMPLPLAFPTLRCPMLPSSEFDSPGIVERSISIQWEAFESLLARPSDRPLLLWLGAPASGQCGKSQLLRELLGLKTAVNDSCASSSGQRGHSPVSPAHAPGVDLLPTSMSSDWTADVHGWASGDPAWMALMATLSATASMIVINISVDDFLVEEERQSSAAPPPVKTKDAKMSRTSYRKPGGSMQVPMMGGGGAAPEQPREPGPVRVSATPELLAVLKICCDARVPGVGTTRTRVFALLRDVPQAASSSQVVGSVRMVLESVLGHCFCGLTCVEHLPSIAGGRRNQVLAGIRGQLQRELSILAETGGVLLPCAQTLRAIYRHFFDRLTLAGEGPVTAVQEFELESRTGVILHKLLSEAEAQASTNLRGFVFPVSEAASQFARLKAQEKIMLEDTDGATPNDAQIAELSSQLRALERNRRALLAQPLTPLVRFFVDSVLGGNQLEHAKIVEFSNSLSAWLNPRMVPLLDRRRQLLDERLRVSQDRRGTSEESKKAHEAELATIARMLAEAEKTLDQFNVSLDLFWGELAAVSDLAMELKSLGIRPPPDTPDPQQLKRFYADWAWQLSCPVQLLHGSPLQCAGSFLVDVLKELGAQHARDLYVISVIGIQSSAKSTLLNYLFGCGFATSAGRCTRGLYCSLMECHGRTLLLLDTEGLMSLEAEGGDIFDAQLALMAMACSHLVIINHKGELSRQLQDLLEVCLFAMQHLKVCRIQPKLLFVLRDQHDRSHAVHTDALRLMRKHLAEASGHLSLRLDELISLDPGSVFLLPSAFASDIDLFTGREVRWTTELFSHEALRLRQKIFQEGSGFSLAACGRGDGEGTPEFSTLPDWCLHTMSVWRVLDRYGPNLLHYKTIQEIEVQRELEELVKHISSQMVHGTGGLAEQAKALLDDFSKRLAENSSTSEQLDTEFRSSLQALLDNCGNRSQAELERCLQVRKSKLPDARKEEARRKLQMPLEYQGELTRYTWTLCLTESLDRDQLKALKMHFKKTIEELWQAQSSNTIAEGQMQQIFASEWQAFEGKCKERFAKTTRSRKQLAEEVCLIFNHVLRQHRHHDQSLHVIELVPATVMLSEVPLTSWEDSKLARAFLEIRAPARLAEYTAQFSGKAAAKPPPPRGFVPTRSTNRPEEQLDNVVVPELRKHLLPVLSFELADGSSQMPSEESLLQAIRRLNEAVQAEEDRFLSPIGVRFQGGRVSFLNAANVCLRHQVLAALVTAEEKRHLHQWQTLQSHRQRTEEEFLGMVQRHTSDSGRAKMLADLFFDALAREWLDQTLVAVAADIRAHCLADMPDASGAAERAYQQSFVERNWEDVVEYVLDVNAYLHKIFTTLFEDRKVSILRVQRPLLVAQLGSLFDALTGAAHRWGHREAGRQSRLSNFQATLRELAAEARASTSTGRSAANDKQSWILLSERFPVVADFPVGDPTRFAHALGVNIASLLDKAKVESIVAERLEAALQKQQAQVWALIRGCTSICPCCGSKCDRVDNHTVHRCAHHLLPAFNGWRVAGTCEAALDACKSAKNHDAPKRSDYSDHLFANLQEYLKAEHPEWLPFPKDTGELLADSVLKAAWVNCRRPLLHRYDMVDSTPREWIEAYEEPHRKLPANAIDAAEKRLVKYGYSLEVD